MVDRLFLLLHCGDSSAEPSRAKRGTPRAPTSLARPAFFGLRLLQRSKDAALKGGYQ
jgi:hypothetical protein